MENKQIIMLVIAISVVLNIFLLTKTETFPIKYEVCEQGYTNCFVNARFKDMYSCQREVEKGNWYCDETDPNNIQCRVPKPGESFASALCTK